MSDYDDEPGSGSTLLWYEVGRSDGYHDGKASAQQLLRHEEAREQRAGVIKVRAADVDGLAKNRDDLWERGTQLARELDQQDEHIAKLEAALEQAQSQISSLKSEHYWAAHDLRNTAANLEKQVRQLNRSLDAKDGALADTEAKLRRSLNYGRGLDRYNAALLKAAEKGKTNLPEYKELKDFLELLRAKWANDPPHPVPTTPNLQRLVEALES